MDRAAFVSNFRAQFAVSLDDAERAADRAGIRAEFRALSPAELAKQQRDANAQEREEQYEITKRFRVCGFTVRNLSQARASKQSPGLADLFITHDKGRAALWWESKRQAGGKYSDAQLTFRADCQRCNVTCLGGDRYDAERYLVMNGFARMGSDNKLTPLGAARDTPGLEDE